MFLTVLWASLQPKRNFNVNLRPIFLKSTLSKVADSFIIDLALKPALLPVIDPVIFGFIAGTSTTLALISMFHHWLQATEGTAATVRIVLLDFRKAFDFDYNILVAKLFSIGVKPTAVNWIIDFLRHRKQRVKLYNTISDWLDIWQVFPKELVSKVPGCFSIHQ